MQNLKRLTAFADNVEPPIRILLGDGDDFRCASDLGDALFRRQHYAESSVMVEALPDHFFVTRLENVQRQRRARKQYDVEWE